MYCDIIDSNYIEFDNNVTAEEWGIRHYGDWGKQYIRNTKIAKKIMRPLILSSPVECYCGNNSDFINDYLRHDIRHGGNTYKEMSELLLLTLLSAPRVPDNIVVYRLVCDEFIYQLIKNNKEGQGPILEKGFISTSLTKEIIRSDESYSKHKNLLKMYVKANSIGIYANSVTIRNEQELILYPSGFFKLLKRPYKYENKVVYECELIYFNDI